MGIPRIKNNQIRPSSVRALIRGGKDLLFVMAVTDHKCMATVRNYHPEPEMGERFSGAHDIMGGQPQKKLRVETVTSQVTKTVSRTSIHHGAMQNDHETSGRSTGGRATVVNQIANKLAKTG